MRPGKECPWPAAVHGSDLCKAIIEAILEVFLEPATRQPLNEIRGAGMSALPASLAPGKTRVRSILCYRPFRRRAAPAYRRTDGGVRKGTQLQAVRVVAGGRQKALFRVSDLLD